MAADASPGPVASAAAALSAHRQDCPACADTSPCDRRRVLAAAWRRALRERGQTATAPAAG